MLLISPAWAGGSDAGWGLNGKFDSLSPALRSEELAVLRSGKVIYLREDLALSPGWSAQAPLLAKLDRAGYRIVGLVPDHLVGASFSGTAAPDLLEVYRRSRALARQADADVAVWELYNEPDGVEMPDRLAACARATFLGLTAESRHPVLLPGLSLPPGPWLERAVANGFLDAGDAFNLHYYGDARNFGGAVRLTRNFLRDHPGRTGLPIWITEIGIKLPPGADPNRQTRYFAETMRTAEEMRLAGFMPYAFRDDGFSLADDTGRPSPALDRYLAESREESLSGPAWADRPVEKARVVLQWSPDPGEAAPDPASGAYLFCGPEMRGAVRLYNFSATPVTGTLAGGGLSSIHPCVKTSDPLIIPALGCLEVPAVFSCNAPGYVREEIHFTWRDSATGQETPLVFGLAAPPRERDFVLLPISARPPDPRGNGFHWIDAPQNEAVTAASGPWLGLNGLEISAPEKSHDLNGPARFRLDPAEENTEPVMAVTKVDGLPGFDFLRLRSDRFAGSDFTVRVDLVDDRGERFTVNGAAGVQAGTPVDEIWLNRRDFQLYFWSRYPARLHPLDPARVREIQLRLRFQKPGQPIRLSLEALRKNP